ncbi:unnamed protein product [Rotaria sp. Silwood1]|nr:unnamed protein product [Rotaria sp. Silwood1]
MSSFSQFINLRSLSLFHVRSKQILMKIVVELRHLVNLTHLCFNSYYLPHHDQTDFELIMSNIWSLPSRTHCNFNIRMKRSQLFSVPPILSSSLEHLSLYGDTFKWNLINRLFQYTPHIKSLRIHINSYNDNDDNEYIKCSFSKLLDLSMTIFDVSYPSKIFSFLQRTPNLCRLNLSMRFGLIDGHQWENIIRNYLPKLKTFRFTMETLFDANRLSKERIDELIN